LETGEGKKKGKGACGIHRFPARPLIFMIYGFLPLSKCKSKHFTEQYNNRLNTGF